MELWQKMGKFGLLGTQKLFLFHLHRKVGRLG